MKRQSSVLGIYALYSGGFWFKSWKIYAGHTVLFKSWLGDLTEFF